MFQVSTTNQKPTKHHSMYAKENIPLLRRVFENERWFQILLIGDLDKYKLGKTARLLAEYHEGKQHPGSLISLAFTLTQEWADQLGQRILVSAETGMGAPPMGLFSPAPKNHFNRRDAQPFDFGVNEGLWQTAIPATNFLPLNCAFCGMFTPAERWRIELKNGLRILVPSCTLHQEFTESRPYQQ
jgi:hypothetical protein